MGEHMKIIHWGILGTGAAAHQFAQGLRSIPTAKLLAVGSRQLATAQSFSQQWSVSRCYSSYEELVADKDVDIVYIATPNVLHKEHCLLGLEAGKAVLCEKPFTLNAKEAKVVIDLAREKQLFCMEAMWMRFIPLIQRVKQLLADGIIGDIKILTADFGVRIPFNEQDRHFNPQLGGGALLDLGIYPISLAFYLLGAPSQVVSQVSWSQSQVDEQSAIIFRYANGPLANLFSSFVTQTPQEAVIMGTTGQLRIHTPIYRPSQFSIQHLPPLTSPSAVTTNWKSTLKQIPLVRRSYNYLSRLVHRAKKQTVPYQGNGYQYEAVEAMRCYQAGEYESKIMPLAETLSILETVDAIRTQWQLQYSTEK
jgi:predicted dehydrogenase